MKREALDGVPKAVIARRYGVSRQSVYNVLKATSVVKKDLKPSKLDPFKDHVAARMSLFDLPATVLLREIKELGYGGGITILKEFVSTCKSEQVKGVIERFETLLELPRRLPVKLAEDDRTMQEVLELLIEGYVSGRFKA